MKEIEYRAAMLLESLGEPVRFQILRHLENGPKTVSDLAHLTHRQVTTVCHHLAVLRTLHIVRYRNRGRFTWYELKVREVGEILALAVRHAPKLSPLVKGAS